MPDLLVAPYLPLSAITSVGSWDLVPFNLVAASAALPDELREPVTRLIEAYTVTGGSVGALGVVAIPHGSQVGAPFDRSVMSQLGHALFVGALGSNPSMAIPAEEQDPNAGWAARAAENALLYGHPVGTGDSYVIETGVLVRVTAVSHAPGNDPLPKIAPPVELPKPMFASFDEELANAAYAALATDDEQARRLHRALDWFRIALSNAEAISLAVRVGAARSALEVLTDASESTKQLVRSYGVLLREPDTTEATCPDVFWAKGPVSLTPDEWWMTRLCMLRNAIVHGDAVPDELWQHDGHHQLDHIHDRLLAALRIVLARLADDELLVLPKADRVFARMAEDMATLLHEATGSADSD